MQQSNDDTIKIQLVNDSFEGNQLVVLKPVMHAF